MVVEAPIKRLRPEPYPVLPLGPFRVVDGKIERFRTGGEHVARFIEKNCVFTNGEWVGRPFKLLDWERQLLLDMFEVVPCARHKKLCRRYRTALVGVGKKQGKTELCAALCLYFLLAADESAPYIVCAAAGDDQADLVFNAAKTMAEQSPTLRDVVQVWEKEIIAPEIPNAVLRRVPASGGRLDGKNVFVSVCDELHEWMPGNQEKSHGMMRGGMAARAHPMNINITTAGLLDEEHLWERYFEYGRKVETGEIDNPTFFFRWWQAPDDCDYTDLSLLPLANPSYGVTVQEAFYVDELGKRHESEYRRYYLNQAVTAETLWLPGGAWDACASADAELLADRTTPTFLGWDGSTKYDSTAVVAVQEVAGKWRVKAWVWERPLNADGQPLREWEIPDEEVTNLIRELCRERHRVLGIAFDPWGITALARQLAGEGLPMIDWPQTDMRMVPATQGAYEAITHGEIQHDGDPTLARHIRNAIAKQTSRGGQRLTKGKAWRPRKFIDAAIAFVMARDLAIRTEVPPASISLGGGPSADSRGPEFKNVRRASF